MVATKRIIFIDLDGTLIRTISGGPFAKCIVDMQPVWKTWNLLKKWAEEVQGEKYLFIVSNQGGIEKGITRDLFMRSKFDFIVSGLREYMRAGQMDVTIDSRYCPSNDVNNPNRKPNIGMFSDLIKSYNLGNVEKETMIMIGDACPKVMNPMSFSSSDFDAANNFNIDYLDITQIS